jgi:long-chain acyl-CoA synthetase
VQKTPNNAFYYIVNVYRGTFAPGIKTHIMARLIYRTPDCDMNATSVIKMYEDSFRRHWDNEALADFRGERITYAELAKRVARVHIILENAGIKPGDKVALCGKNCLAWGVAFFGVYTYGAIPVPILNDFKPANIHTLVNHSEAKLLMVGDVVLAGMVAAEMPDILGIILLNDMSLQFSRSNELTKAMETLDECFDRKYPKGFTKDDIKYQAEKDTNDLAVLNYTSGTTSDPKGVMVPYRAMLVNLKFACGVLPLTKGETVVSILPMAHMFGLAFQLMFELLLGASICYLGKMPSPKILFDAFAEEKPKLIITVPLVIEKVIKQKIQPVMEKPLMKVLMAIPGVNRLIGGKIRSKIIDAFGGEMDCLIVGGAALNADVEKILRKLKFPYTVGYGSTECAPLISYVDWEKYKAGSCGIAVPGCPVEVFSDAPGNVGELLVKGDNVMLGYYKNPNATRDVIDPEGWFHTGDMGTIDKQGYIYIKGRCKNMILGPSGQNIYPEEIEDLYMNQQLVSEVLIVERERKLVALVLPDYDAGKAASLNEQQVLAQLEEDRKKINTMLPGYSQVSKLEIRTEPFERTPKRSIRRFLYK